MSPVKLARLRAGLAPVSEPGLGEALAAHLAAGRVAVTERAVEALARAETALVCVGTASAATGVADATQVLKVMTEIAAALPAAAAPFVIALRSTLPGSVIAGEVVPLLARALGARLGADVLFVVNPEFLREGQGLADFMAPPYVIVGTDHAAAIAPMRELYRGVAAPFHVVSPGTASLVKYAANAFHALKVAYANEVAAVAPAFGADGDQVMALVREDRILNVSPAYLRPGYAFGGSCLPKDLRALNRVGEWRARRCRCSRRSWSPTRTSSGARWSG